MAIFPRWIQKLSGHWNEPVPHTVPLRYLTPAMAIRRSVLGHAVPDGYRYACAFFGVGLIDRTGTLDIGFPVHVLDPIPVMRPVKDLAALCDARAAALVAEARDKNLRIRVLWSGGIDSTAATVALLRNLADEPERLEIACNRASIREYRFFNRMLKRRNLTRLRIKRIEDALTPDALVVTGEHGDQIFGSMLAADLSTRKMHRPWEQVIPDMFRRKLSDKDTAQALDYLAPQRAACPIPLETAFDMLWWWNFSLKWQTVSERILAPLPAGTRERAAPVIRHFFRTDEFQRWSLANPDKRIERKWASYKWPLKDYIHDFTGDAKYRKYKQKERSLRGLLSARSVEALAIDIHGTAFTQPSDSSLRNRRDRSFSFGIGE